MKPSQQTKPSPPLQLAKERKTKPIPSNDRFQYKAAELQMIPLFLFLLSAIIHGVSGDDTSPAVLRRVCGPTKALDAETFDVNFVNTMELIYQNITVSGFGSASYGGTGGRSTTVYGVGQCFGYLSSVDCQLCYAQSRVQLPLCLPATNSRIYLDGCFLRYADSDFVNQPLDSYDASICSNASIPSFPTVPFANLTTALIENLTVSAVDASDYYKVGNTVGSLGVKLYGMAQCWRSLNRSSCKECLEDARLRISRCLSVAADDGKVLNAGCYLRYSTQAFYSTAPAQGGDSSVKHILGIVLGCSFSAVLIVGVAIFCLRRRASKSSTHLEVDGSAEFIKSISKSCLTFKYEDLMKATDNFSQNNKLGQGGYGSVYKGILLDGREVAVKRLFFNTRQSVEQFFNEVQLINQIEHKNLVKLYGCSLEGPESLLVYEHLCNTSLDHFLFDSFKKNALDWERRLGIIIGTAEGLAYLHNASEVRIIHRDIKASNVLLDINFRPKIADFGLARPFAEDQSHLSTCLAGTLGYMAPEYIMHGQLTEKADIYSYGILVMEIVTGRKNFNSTATLGDGNSLVSLIWQHFTSNTTMELLDPYLQCQCDGEQVLKVMHVALLCTQASPNLRPPMWKVVEMLTSKLIRDLPQPTPPPFMNSRPPILDVRSGSSETSQGGSSSSNKYPASANQLSLSIVQAR